MNYIRLARAKLPNPYSVDGNMFQVPIMKPPSIKICDQLAPEFHVTEICIVTFEKRRDNDGTTYWKFYMIENNE